MWGKKTWGRKRHVLVDTQGNLLAIKVTGAHRSDQQGARGMLKPLKESFPKIKLLWGDSHYGGTDHSAGCAGMWAGPCEIRARPHGTQTRLTGSRGDRG
jgi:hypothetical protein